MQKISQSFITKSDVDRREIEFIASHQRPDRDSEVILISGIDTGPFMLNPLLFTQHETRQAGVARVVELKKTVVDKYPALVGRAVFPDLPRSLEALDQIRAGVLNAVSIGFLVTERGGPIMEGQSGDTLRRTQLLEVSLVGLPACPTCVITSKAACSCSGKDDDVLAGLTLPPLTLDIDHAPVLDLIDEEDLIDHSPTVIASTIAKAVCRTLQKEAAAAARSRINYLRGRVD